MTYLEKRLGEAEGDAEIVETFWPPFVELEQQRWQLFPRRDLFLEQQRVRSVVAVHRRRLGGSGVSFFGAVVVVVVVSVGGVFGQGGEFALEVVLEELHGFPAVTHSLEEKGSWR